MRYWIVMLLELVSVGGFVFFLWQSKAALAFACLFGALQVLLTVFLLREEYRLAIFMCALMPLTCFELLPDFYAHFVLYAGTLGLMLLLRVTGGASYGHGARLAVGERLSLQLLAVLVVVSAAHAVLLRGWGSYYLFRYALLTEEVLLAAWMFAVIPVSLSRVRTLAHVTGASAVLGVVVLLLQPGSANEVGLLGGKTMATPFGAVNLNPAGSMIGALAAILAVGVLDEKNRFRQVMLAVAAVALFAGLVYTKSRGAWLGFGVALVYVVLRLRSKQFLVAATAGLAGLLSIGAVRFVLLSRLSVTGLRDPSLWGRFLLWRSAWDVFRENWLLGVGMENFRYVKHLYGFPWPMRFGVAYNSHSIYLEVLVGLGVLGLAGLLWLIVGSFVRLDRVARDARQEGRILAIGLNAALIVYSVHGLLDCITWQHGAFMSLGVLLGLAMCVARLAGDARASTAA